MALVSSRTVFNKGIFMYNIRRKKYRVRNLLDAFNSKRPYSISNYGLSDTTIFLQNGLDIQELPLIVKKISGCEASQLLFSENVGAGTSSTGVEVACPNDNSSKLPRKEEVEEMIDGFKRCNSIHEVLKLLEVVPSTYVEPAVAFHIVKKMIELDYIYSIVGERNDKDVSKNFTKTAVFNQLMGIVLSNDSDILVSCLKLMGQHSVFRKYLRPFQQKLHEQIMIRMTQNKFNVCEICEIVEEFHLSNKTQDIDKLWLGITENYKNIDQHNIMNVYRVLPHFKASRGIVAKTLLKKITDVWWYMDGKSVAEILDITKTTQTYSYQLFEILARWLNTKIHSVTEDELLSIVNGFKSHDFVNSQVISAIERYVKVRGEMIEDGFLFAGITDFCVHFKIRSPSILDKACDYFISKGNTLSPAVIKSLFVPFGNLNYNPTRSYEFWKKFEEIFEDKFSYFNPDHVVEIMMSCVYLEKYPINFTNHVLNPYFLNRLQMSSKDWGVTKRNLKMFDHIMTFECSAYKGPLIPRGFPPPIIQNDERIQALLQKYRGILLQIAGKNYNVTSSKCIRTCPIQSSCFIDVLFVPRECNLSNYVDFCQYTKPLVAILIHVPEHYTYQGDYLMGPQVLRKRHLSRLGFNVVSLKFIYLTMLGNSFDKVQNYIESSINEVVNFTK